ncbi:MAG: asparagine synthase (glutamine-hydrolyzing) [Eubacteriales bacterium]|nr:asparagine synthase (glutamine-hydrolyzing) [Eubacteriales bacterium]
MCGICGFVGRKKEKNKILHDMMKVIDHRGPDSNGTHITEEVALGFCRLSIIDLEDGNQPMNNEKGDLTLIFNGEIYNYRKLREELMKEGHHFATHSDSEVLLHGLESYGKDLLDRLRGMFAFAVWDEKKNRLFIARDFFGIKPVYYAEIDGCFVFASEIKSILEFPGCPREVNEEALEQYLSFQYSALEETFFKGIYKLMPGCFLTYENGQVKIQKYFDPMLHPEETGDDEKLTQHLERVIKDSVDTHMVSDVEVGAFLSGGVDSSYIASEFSGKKVFTVGFLSENSQYSEVSRARGLAEKLELEHHSKIISKEEFWQAVPEVMYYLDEPSGDAAAVALYFVAEEASKYVKVVTSGEGADELFGGYNIYREPLALRWMNWMPERFRRGLGRFAEKLPEIKGRNYLIRAGKSVEERFIGNARIFSTEERREIMRRRSGAVSTEKLLQKDYKQAAGLEDMEKMQYIDLKYWLPGDILQKADKMSMAHSLELRVPFLDRNVFETARKMPLKAKLRHNSTKYIFRQAAARHLPKETSEMKKLGFPVPIRLWMKDGDWYREIKTAFLSKTARNFFHVDKLVKLLDEHLEGKRDNSRKIWTVYAFLVWHKKFFAEV